MEIVWEAEQNNAEMEEEDEHEKMEKLKYLQEKEYEAIKAD